MWAPSIGGAVIFETNRKLKSKSLAAVSKGVDFVYNRSGSSARLGYRSLTTELIDLREQEDVSCRRTASACPCPTCCQA